MACIFLELVLNKCLIIAVFEIFKYSLCWLFFLFILSVTQNYFVVVWIRLTHIGSYRWIVGSCWWNYLGRIRRYSFVRGGVSWRVELSCVKRPVLFAVCVPLSASNLQINIWALSLWLSPCILGLWNYKAQIKLLSLWLPSCILGLWNYKSPIKCFLLKVTLVLKVYHSSRKITRILLSLYI